MTALLVKIFFVKFIVCMSLAIVQDEVKAKKEQIQEPQVIEATQDSACPSQTLPDD